MGRDLGETRHRVHGFEEGIDFDWLSRFVPSMFCVVSEPNIL